MGSARRASERRSCPSCAPMASTLCSGSPGPRRYRHRCPVVGRAHRPWRPAAMLPMITALPWNPERRPSRRAGQQRIDQRRAMWRQRQACPWRPGAGRVVVANGHRGGMHPRVLHGDARAMGALVRDPAAASWSDLPGPGRVYIVCSVADRMPVCVIAAATGPFRRDARGTREVASADGHRPVQPP